MIQNEKHPGGRPPIYNSEYPKLAYNYSLMGATDEQMITFLGIASSTFYKWQKEHSEFSEAIKNGKEKATAKVAASMFKRATGISYTETKIVTAEHINEKGEKTRYEKERVETKKYIPPDTGAGAFILKNKAGWKDKQEYEHTGTINIIIDKEDEGVL